MNPKQMGHKPGFKFYTCHEAWVDKVWETNPSGSTRFEAARNNLLCDSWEDVVALNNPHGRMPIDWWFR